MPSVKTTSGLNINLGELNIPLDLFPSKITYGAQFEMRRTTDPKILSLTEFSTKSQQSSSQTAPQQHFVHWKDCSVSVKEAFKRKFQIQSPPPSPTLAPQHTISASLMGQIKTTVNTLMPWEKNPAQAAITQKLQAHPANEQQRLLNLLNSQLSAKPSDQKATTIQNWANSASMRSVDQATDLRTNKEREMQDWLEQTLQHPECKQYVEAIKDFFTGQQRNHLIDTNSRHNASFSSALYRKIYKDQRGPLPALQDIYNLLTETQKYSKYQALLDWEPPQ